MNGYDLHRMKIETLDSLMSDIGQDDPTRAENMASVDRDERAMFVDPESGMECLDIRIPSLVPRDRRPVE